MEQSISSQVVRKPHERKINPLYWKVGSRISNLLGSESVSDMFVAINELVKNAYDADAIKTTVSFEGLKTGSPVITISDDGEGMEYYDIDNGWMFIATDNKVRDPLTKKYKRRKIGHKGIGRFAVQNLSRVTELISYPKNQDQGYRVVINWDDYTGHQQQVNSVPNEAYTFKKSKSKHGVEIKLYGLRHSWNQESIRKLSRNLSFILPPNTSGAKFQTSIHAPEFSKYSGRIKSSFLKNAVFVFKGSLKQNGEIRYELKPKKGRKVTYKERLRDFTCGPVEFTLFFFYREKEKLKKCGINIENLETFRNILDDYGGIKLYRDSIRVTGFGEPGNDWINLDGLRVNDPTRVPSNSQIIGFVKISAGKNPLLVDTTTREGIVGGPAYDDLRDFVRASVKYFAKIRGQLEGKRKPKSKTQSKKQIKKIKESLRAKQEPKKFLDFRGRYKEVFYEPLEDEINECYRINQPNACIILSRKLIENLLFNILEYKFPSQPNLWWNTSRNSPSGFEDLIKNLKSNRGRFTSDEQDLIDAFGTRVGRFRLDANKKTHRIMDYFESVDELKKYKISEIVEIEIKLINKIHGMSSK